MHKRRERTMKDWGPYVSMLAESVPSMEEEAKKCTVIEFISYDVPL